MWEKIKYCCLLTTWECFVFLIPILISVLITWFSEGINNISTKALWIIIIILFSMVAFLIRAFINTIRIIDTNEAILPKLLKIKKERLVFGASELFSSQSVVSIYNKDDIEEYVGYGQIETITKEGLIQVIMKQYENGWSEENVKTNQKNIILKPSLPIDILNGKN